MHWAITETLLDLRKSMPLWIAQGHRFSRNKKHYNGIQTTEEQAKMILEDEGQTLESSYMAQEIDDDPMSQFATWEETEDSIMIMGRAKKSGIMGFNNLADLDEEQEVSKSKCSACC